MTRFEYKVVPAPRRGEKAKGARRTEDRFAHALTEIMNAMGREGWQYLRADTLPCEERHGLTGRTTTFQHMLVFARALPAPAEAGAAAAAPRLGPARPAVSAEEPEAPATEIAALDAPLPAPDRLSVAIEEAMARGKMVPMPVKGEGARRLGPARSNGAAPASSDGDYLSD